MRYVTGPLYARKGEEVVCENLHRICTVARDVRSDEPMPEDMLTDWTQPPPVRGMANVVCAQCGAPFYQGPVLMFRDGYRAVKI